VTALRGRIVLAVAVAALAGLALAPRGGARRGAVRRVEPQLHRADCPGRSRCRRFPRSTNGSSPIHPRGSLTSLAGRAARASRLRAHTQRSAWTGSTRTAPRSSARARAHEHLFGSGVEDRVTFLYGFSSSTACRWELVGAGAAGTGTVFRAERSAATQTTPLLHVRSAADRERLLALLPAAPLARPVSRIQGFERRPPAGRVLQREANF
jgi:hypothetical protein